MLTTDLVGPTLDPEENGLVGVLYIFIPPAVEYLLDSHIFRELQCNLN
jgi:hypothetical protein